MKWQHYPNLRLRPHAPNRGRGRLQVQIRRCFLGGGVRSSTEVYNWCYVRQRLYGERVRQWERYSVWRVLMQVAEPVGRASTRRPRLWRLKA